MKGHTPWYCDGVGQISVLAERFVVERGQVEVRAESGCSRGEVNVGQHVELLSKIQSPICEGVNHHGHVRVVGSDGAERAVDGGHGEIHGELDLQHHGNPLRKVTEAHRWKKNGGDSRWKGLENGFCSSWERPQYWNDAC